MGRRRADDRSDEDLDGVAEWFMRRMVGDDTWEKMPAGIRDDRRAEGRALLADLRAIEPGVPPPYRPERVTAPRGGGLRRERPHRHRTAALRMADRAPDAELVVVPGADHGVHLSDPRAFADLRSGAGPGGRPRSSTAPADAGTDRGGRGGTGAEPPGTVAGHGPGRPRAALPGPW